jgi:hypothetical protein
MQPVQAGCESPPRPPRPRPHRLTARDEQHEVLVQHVQLLPQRRRRLRPRRGRHQVQVAPHHEDDVEGARGDLAHAVPLVADYADDGLDDGEEAWGAAVGVG